MSRRAYILGCSHAAGSDMVSDRSEKYFCDPQSRWVYDSFTYGFHHSYPTIIARDLGYVEIHNHAIPGGSTDAMLRIFRETSGTVQADQDIVIACWTAGDRSEYYDQKENLWVQLSSGQSGFLRRRKSPIALQGTFFENPAVNDRYHDEKKKWILESSIESCNHRLITNVIRLNQEAHDLNIKVMNLVSFYSPNCQLKDRNISRFWWPVGIDPENTFISYSQSQGYKKDSMGHFLEAAHQDYAKWVLDKIKNTNIEELEQS